MSLTEFEQAIIDEVNLARTKPRDYAAHIHNVMKRNVDTVNSYEELFSVLKVRSSVNAVRISKGLSLAARKRAEAVSTRLRVFDQSDLYGRVSKYGKVEDPGSLKEVVWAGRTGSDIRKLVLTILADETNPNRFRRTALLSASSTVCGVAVSGSVITVILAKGFQEMSALASSNVHHQHGVSGYGGKYLFGSHVPGEESGRTRQVMTPPHRMASPSTPRLNDYSDIKKILPQAGVAKAVPPPAIATPQQTQQVPAAPARVAAAPADGGHTIVGLSTLKTTLASGNGESNYVGFNSKLRTRIIGWLNDVERPVLTR